MRRLVHLGVAVILLIGITVVALPQRPAGTPAPQNKAGRSEPEQQLFDLLNQEREKAGLNKLQWDDHLAQAARDHSREMAQKRDLVHQFADEPAVPERLAAAGARFTLSAENVATAETSEEAHMALMASPGHRANILDSRYNAAGIGVVEIKGHLFVTQDFALVERAYTEAEFREAFIAAFNHARTARRIPAIDARADSALHAAACSTQGDAPVVAASGFTPTEVVAFTLSDPEKIPQQLMRYVQDDRQSRMSLGVCFRPDPKFGYANFWVVAAFGG